VKTFRSSARIIETKQVLDVKSVIFGWMRQAIQAKQEDFFSSKNSPPLAHKFLWKSEAAKQPP
jgi:hypothetical protein